MGFTKLKYMPYINFYLDNIDRLKHDVHVLYWNRDGKNEDISKYKGCILHEFSCRQQDDVLKLSKLKSFLKYRNFTKKLLKKNGFDFIFVLHSLTGVVVADILKKKYKNRYIFDYRDVTYESLAPYRRIVESLTKNSAATFVSSDDFRTILPQNCKDKIYTSHNLLVDSLKHRDEKTLYGTDSEKIRVVFWGFIRHEHINKEIIRKFSADSRFELHFYGREQKIALSLKEYSKKISAVNVFFHGEYTPEQRYVFARNTDVIHNLYSNIENPSSLHAMTNKYYDGIIFRIPQLCVTGSFMAKRSENAGVGFSCDPYDEYFTEKVYSYYKNTDKKEFFSNCDFELEKVLNEYNRALKKIKEIVDA